MVCCGWGLTTFPGHPVPAAADVPVLENGTSRNIFLPVLLDALLLWHKLSHLCTFCRIYSVVWGCIRASSAVPRAAFQTLLEMVWTAQVLPSLLGLPGLSPHSELQTGPVWVTKARWILWRCLSCCLWIWHKKQHHWDAVGRDAMRDLLLPAPRACLRMGLGVCLRTPLSCAHQEQSLLLLLGVQGQCRRVWEQPVRKLLGVCLSCESLLELSHLTWCRCCAVCPVCPPPVPGVQPQAPCLAQLSPGACAPDPSWKVSAVFAFRFGFSVCQKPSCQMCKTGGTDRVCSI